MCTALARNGWAKLRFTQFGDPFMRCFVFRGQVLNGPYMFVELSVKDLITHGWSVDVYCGLCVIFM